MNKPTPQTVEILTELPPPSRPQATPPAPAPANPRKLATDQGVWDGFLGQVGAAKNLRPPGNR